MQWGKRALLKGKHGFSTKEVLGIAKEVEEKTAVSKPCKRCKPPLIKVKITQTDFDMSESDMSEAESDCIIVSLSRLLSTRNYIITDDNDDDNSHAGFTRRPYEPSPIAA
jgi:hypothetical protein